MDDLVGHALGQVGWCWRPATWRQVGRRHPGQALGEDHAVGAGDLDAPRRRRKPPSTPMTPAGQQRHARARAAPGGRRRRPRCGPLDRRRRRSRACGRRCAAARGWTTVPTPGDAGHRVGQHAGRGGRRRSPPARPTTRPSWPPPPSRPCRRSPAPCRRRRPRASSSRSTSTISSMSEAWSSRRGSAVSSPAVSVSSTSRSAPTRWATRAARRSLSPKRISSSAMASFSLTTGTTPSSSRRRSVPRAWRYCWRMPKSSGASSTWPATRPWPAKHSS